MWGRSTLAGCMPYTAAMRRGDSPGRMVNTIYTVTSLHSHVFTRMGSAPVRFVKSNCTKKEAVGWGGHSILGEPLPFGELTSAGGTICLSAEPPLSPPTIRRPVWSLPPASACYPQAAQRTAAGATCGTQFPFGFPLVPPECAHGHRPSPAHAEC